MRRTSQNIISLSFLAFLSSSPLLAQSPAPAAPTQPSETASETLNDSQIVSIANAANQAEIQSSKLAQNTSKNPQVKEFASMMVEDHTSSRTKMKELSAKNKLKTEESTLLKTLETAAESSAAKLKPLTGPEFDKAYLTEQVKMHQTVLDAIESTLIPKASDENLKTQLGKMRETVATHLEHAKRLETSVGQMSSSR